MNRRFYIAGFLIGLLGVVLGAFATHGLQPLITSDALRSLETGIKYQLYHSFLLLVLGNSSFLKPRLASWIFYLVLAGVFLFSGSIYLLATNSLTNFDFTLIALLTPLGGSLLILCWILLLLTAIKLKKK